MSRHALRTGLEAVERVRNVREQDSRQGLHLAQREVTEAQQLLADTVQQLTDLNRATATTPGALIRQREDLLSLGDAVVAARDALEAAQVVAAAARTHWQQDRVRLRTIEMLQERRRQRVRDERARAQARVDDEVATQLWRRGGALS